MDNRLHYGKTIMLQQNCYNQINCKTTNPLNEITCSFFNVTCYCTQTIFDQNYVEHYFTTHNLNCLL